MQRVTVCLVDLLSSILHPQNLHGISTVLYENRCYRANLYLRFSVLVSGTLEKPTGLHRQGQCYKYSIPARMTGIQHHQQLLTQIWRPYGTIKHILLLPMVGNMKAVLAPRQCMLQCCIRDV
jgi:hypothetical protein